MIQRLLAPSSVVFLALATAFSAGACGGGDPPFDEGLATLDAEAEAQLDAFCACYADFAQPFQSQEECVTSLTLAPDPAYDQCLLAAYELDAESSHARMNCEIKVEEQATECMQSTYTCTDPTTFNLCAEAEVQARQQCPALAAVVVDAIIACAN